MGESETVYSETVHPVAVQNGIEISVTTYKAGGHEYPMKVAKKCNACSSSNRGAIETEMMKGTTYVAISREYPEVTPQGLSNHLHRGHMPINNAILASWQEEEAKSRGIDLTTFDGSVANYIALARIGVKQALDKLVDGKMDVELKDAVALANLLQKAEIIAKEGERDVSHIRQMVLLREAIIRFCTPEQIEALGQYISSGMASIESPVQDVESPDE